MDFEDKLEIAFNPPDTDHIKEGTVVPISKIVSSAIGVPSGDYIVASVTGDHCKLIPTSEAGNSDSFEVHRPTLAGFFNPEIHNKTVEPINYDGSILERKIKPLN